VFSIGDGVAMPTPICFHLDENVTSIVATSLRTRGIDVTTTSEAGLLAASDEEQLAHALHAGRILVTRDHDFLVIASRGTQHAGIIYWPPSHERLGDVIKMLTLLWRIETTESMAGRIEFL
jgi:uncharacterized protein with PIN domain